MDMQRRKLIFAAGLAAVAGLGGCSVATPPAQSHARGGWPADDELVGGNDRDAMIAAAREIMKSQGHAALVTVDGGGMPRVRTVGTRDPEDDMTIWFATNPVSRKVAQLRARPEVALHWVQMEHMATVTLMGRATIHLDQAAWQSKQFFSDEQITQFWPKYPNDFCMVSVQPLWMEIIAPHKQIKGDAEKWRPAGMRFDT